MNKLESKSGESEEHGGAMLKMGKKKGG